MGACSVVLGAILSPAVIFGAANGCANSFPFVGSGSGSGGGGGCDDMHAPPIWCDDMVRRYAPPICTTDMQGRKTEKAKSMLLLAP